MTDRMKSLASEIVRLQGELDREIETRRKTLGYSVRKQIAEFEHGIVSGHRRFKTSITQFIGESPVEMLVTAPVIYSLIVPFLILDIWVTVYQAICFRAYRIPLVRRVDYINFDRRHLAYLNGIEAMNCMFCAYGNGLIAYVREISSRTEQFWCPIKHALHVSDPHLRYYEFLEYGDAHGYRTRLESFREKLRQIDSSDTK
ncbi:hypothetical protein BH09PSE3_BH09PSE3_15720 [soil metagenome]